MLLAHRLQLYGGRITSMQDENFFIVLSVEECLAGCYSQTPHSLDIHNLRHKCI